MQKKRRKKSRFWYYLYAVLVLFLTITNLTLATLLLTHVQTIDVKGTQYSQKSEIVQWIKEDPLAKNSLYVLWKYRFGHYTLPVYLKKADVSLVAPWKVRVRVQEKQVTGCILLEDTYVYFDAEGLVLRTEGEYDGATPLIEGLQVKKAEVFEYLDVENKKVFSYIVDVAEELQESALKPDRVVWEENSMNLYFAQVCVKLGKSDFQEKVLQLPPILQELEGKSGTLHLEHYTKDTTGISFEKSDAES